MQTLRALLLFGTIFLFATLLSSCSKEEIVIDSDTTSEVSFDDTDFTPTDWTVATHSKEADPNFEEVFDNNAVKRLDIVITEERWESMPQQYDIDIRIIRCVKRSSGRNIIPG